MRFFTSFRMTNVAFSSLRHSLVAGEDEGGGLNDLNFLNELNRAEGVAYCLRSGGLVSITVARE
jgi:hypothetical protein